MPLSFHEGLPDELLLNFDAGIFHDPKHVMLQATSGWRSFYMRGGNNLEGVVHFYIEKDQATSPYKSPFGSYLFSTAVTYELLTEFVTYCEQQLRNGKIATIILKNQPEIYSSEKNHVLGRVLTNLGYTIRTEETSAVIPVTDKNFDSGLHKSEKKRLRKCRENGLVFELAALSQLQKIYTFLEACREEKGYTLSMPYREIQKLSKAFPDRIMLTTVIDRNKIVAANISIRVYHHVLYNFYHDHAGEYDLLSPVVLLNEGLYQFCRQNKIQFLDLGTSNIEGELNESLLKFKVNLGAKPSRKLTFTKNLV